MKTFNQTNFFKHTFCEFQQVDNFDFPENTNYKSKSQSVYFYTNDGVYRKSNHWGRVANCRWKIIANNNNYKNQQMVIGFAKWMDFYPINSTEKIFHIDVNFEEKTSKIKASRQKSTFRLFTFSDAQKRIKQINQLFKDDQWAKYLKGTIEDLRFEIISDFIKLDKTLVEIKRDINNK